MADLLFIPGSTPEPLQYERKTVVFYDVLGWRDQIKRAGNDPTKIARLQRMILRPIQNLRAGKDTLKFQFSAFSDNIAISCAPDRDSIFRLLTTLGSFVLGSTAAGFLVRGGLTLGEIVHNDHAVFGPALNRAYEIESTIASVPRIVIDKDAFEIQEWPFFVGHDGGTYFVDPFTTSFIRFLQNMSAAISPDKWQKAGFDDASGLHRYDAENLLTGALQGLKGVARSPLADKEYKKVEWLYDRIAGRLGVPPLRSYPRLRADDVAG